MSENKREVWVMHSDGKPATVRGVPIVRGSREELRAALKYPRDTIVRYVPAEPEQAGKVNPVTASVILKRDGVLNLDNVDAAIAAALASGRAEAGQAQAGKAEQKAYEQLVADALTLAIGVTNPGTIGAHHLVEASSRIHAAHGKFRPAPPSPPTSKGGA